jgi:hypothetical protein
LAVPGPPRWAVAGPGGAAHPVRSWSAELSVSLPPMRKIRPNPLTGHNGAHRAIVKPSAAPGKRAVAANCPRCTGRVAWHRGDPSCVKEGTTKIGGRSGRSQPFSVELRWPLVLRLGVTERDYRRDHFCGCQPNSGNNRSFPDGRRRDRLAGLLANRIG